jgi:hypothetical protein
MLLIRKTRPILALIFVMAVIGLLSCGGGGSAGGGGGGGGGGGTPQTVNVAVTAQAANTQSDMDNQKTVGLIVITLK